MGSSTRAGRHQSFQLRYEDLDDPLNNNIIEDNMNDLNREEHASGEEEENLGGPVMRKTRGGTFMKHIWGTPKGFPKRTLEKNRYGQPVGEKRGTLSHYMGTIARNGAYCPINVDDWRHISRDDKEVMLKLVKEKFEVEPVMEPWILQSIGKGWRNWKTKLREDYKKRKTVEVRVQENQWTGFKSNCNTEKAKAGAIVAMKSMSDASKTVAKGILSSLNPSNVVGGTALGKNWCEVLVQVVVENSENLIRPYDMFYELRDVLGCPVAWPCHLVIVDDE